MALIHCNFHSEVLRMATSMDVILPQPTLTQIGMNGVARKKAHPTLYLLHGLSDDHTIWQRRTSIERYVAPLGLAVVMPTVQRGFYTNMSHGPAYGTFVREELPAVARSFFHLSAERKDNFVAGLSMGGYGALKLGLLAPEQFAAAASLSGALDIPGRCAEAVKSDPFRAGEMADIFGPAEKVAGSENDLFHLAKKLASSDSPRPALYLACGTEDGLYDHSTRFRDHARKLGLDITYEEGPGKHEWGFWDAWIQRVLAWLPIRRRA